MKTVLITGATSGIGEACAHIFAENGYRLIITGRREEKLKQLAQTLQTQYGTNTLPLVFDVTDKVACENAITKLPTDYQQIDILINNAGLAAGLNPIHEGLHSDWETMIDTNIK
ncbi:MAG: SDR family NAD(P)-dependent oxidoreductase, partial [Bacteroidia bacterium]